jgi:hypothetical protein
MEIPRIINNPVTQQNSFLQKRNTSGESLVPWTSSQEHKKQEDVQPARRTAGGHHW